MRPTSATPAWAAADPRPASISTSKQSALDIAVAVIEDDHGRVLLSRRAPHVHQGGRWEFPGGKAEPGEGRLAALQREIDEELGIRIVEARPLIRVRHRYPEHEVLLDVWRVGRFDGAPYGREGQELRWVAPSDLSKLTLPDANRPIVTAVMLPSVYLITPEPETDDEAFIARLAERCREGVQLVQFRAKGLGAARFDRLARAAIDVCHSHGARVLVNTSPEHAMSLNADGVHLARERLMQLSARPLPADKLVGASCHDRAAIEQAERIETDFVVIAPVLAATSHPGAQILDWKGLQALTEVAVMPAYALGGMRQEHLPLAWQHGAQGIAAIRSLWEVRLRSSSA